MSNHTTPKQGQWNPTQGIESTKIGSECGWNLAGASTPGALPSSRHRKKRVPWEAPEEEPASKKKARPVTEKVVHFTKMTDAQFFKNMFKLCRLQKETESNGGLFTFETIVQENNDVKLGDFCGGVVNEYIRCRRIPSETFSENDTWLKEDRLMILDQLGFPWPAEANRSSPAQVDKAFSKRVQQLVSYKKQHGDLLVPFDYPEQNLVRWMEQIREDDVVLKGGKPTLSAIRITAGLNQERRDLLAALGFDWVYDQILQQRLRELKTFHNEQEEKENNKSSGKFGIHVPSSHSGTLGSWCARMRSYHRQLRMGTFEGSDHLRERAEQRIEHLKKIGLRFDVYQQAVSWEERFQQLVEFKERHGHCNCPQHWSENKELGKWVNSQRRYHNEPQKRMTQDRIDKLEALGFVWKLRDRFFDRDWEERFASLQTYQQVHQDCNVPSSWSEDPLLSKWVARVREEYRKHRKGKPSKLTEERIQQLAKLGFQWNQPSSQTVHEISRKGT